MVAWLHDVLEDSPITAADLLGAGIPEHLVDAVSRLTKHDCVEYEDYLEKVSACPIATDVKVADMLTNLADTPTREQIRKYAIGLLHFTAERPEN